MQHTVVLSSEQATLDLAASLAKSLAGAGEHLIIYLEGELGAGKTTFARGFIQGSGYQGIVKSPTYTLVEPYSIDTDNNIYHFDLYRLSDPEELEFTGARDYFDSASTCLIEWPQKASGHLPAADLICAIEVVQERRKLNLTAVSNSAKSLLLQEFSDISH